MDYNQTFRHSFRLFKQKLFEYFGKSVQYSLQSFDLENLSTPLLMIFQKCFSKPKDFSNQNGKMICDLSLQTSSPYTLSLLSQYAGLDLPQILQNNTDQLWQNAYFGKLHDNLQISCDKKQTVFGKMDIILQSNKDFQGLCINSILKLKSLLICDNF